MFQRRIPEWLRHAPVPGVHGFAILTGTEAVARGILISVFPIAMYRALGDAETVSEIWFLIGIASMTTALLVPWLTRFIARRFMYTAGALLMIGGALTAAQGGLMVPVGLTMTTTAVVIMFVCLNAYVMDYVERSELGRCETLRMFYAALGWTIGPAAGMWLYDRWPMVPFLISAAAATVILAIFWYLRLGNGKQIARARGPAPTPLAYLPRFLAQPRLVAGWLFAVLRSCGWWVYVVYMPIFAVESGYAPELGSYLLSLTNATLFATPLMLTWMRRRSVRRAVRTGFAGATILFATAAAVAGLPWLTLGLLVSGSVFLILLDIAGGLPFLMAVRPGERTEMSAVYSTFRDVSGIVTPGVARLVLFVAPLPAVFGAAAVGLAVCYLIAGKLHPRLGQRRLVPARAIPVAEAA